MLQFVSHHWNTFNKFTSITPSSRYHNNWLADPAILTTQINPYMMVRIVNLADFLERYPYQKSEFEPITLVVQDANLPENTGVWQIQRVAGQTQYQKLSAKAETKGISIQRLTSVLLGSTKLQDLRRTGENPWSPTTTQH
ncbi:sterol carrier protein domain-containing protein [Lactobacillus sp. DCY120]|uniref:Sterol carrier protein domain-containing protein n=1 Tax=Bombilactobacillus apium TaxID=2675299 RepID=A0A850RA99_9LACO|nr:sterol carrier protein domain-containing protein [Bombilactobacillus apium]NVY96286.1 sterol carrier protein domain-containing protein [Bombilactobacillus apium]